MEQAQSCVETAPDSALHYLSLLKDSIGCEPEETQMYCPQLMATATR